MSDLDRVLHVLKYSSCGGGMETIVQAHRQRGESVVAITPNCGEAENTNHVDLGGSVWSRLGTLRGSLSRYIKKHDKSFDCTLFYNGYGVEWLENDDKLGRKFLYLHTDFPRLIDWIHRTLRYVDGYIVVNSAIVDKIRKEIPYLPANRLHVLPYPVKIPDENFARRREARKQLVIGYSGRLQWRQKRLDRLVALKESLDATDFDYRFEFLGDGPARDQIEKYFSGDDRWFFHGHLVGEDYWKVLNNWKYIVFLSDYEGLPISLLEGVAAGAVPIYPKIFDSGDWVESINPDLVYPFGEAKAIGTILEQVEKWEPFQWENFWVKSELLLKDHLGNGYEVAYEEFLAKLDQYPVRKKHYPAAYLSWYPLWFYHRIQHRLQFGSFSAPKFKKELRVLERSQE